ncbi:hypothetical protein FRC08_013307, partial [Ceratobasidium sp. 394]
PRAIAHRAKFNRRSIASILFCRCQPFDYLRTPPRSLYVGKERSGLLGLADKMDKGMGISEPVGRSRNWRQGVFHNIRTFE